MSLRLEGTISGAGRSAIAVIPSVGSGRYAPGPNMAVSSLLAYWGQHYTPTVCPSVASRNLLLYQSLPISIPYRQDNVRRRKDAHRVGTAARGIVEGLHRFSRRVRIHC